MGLILAVTLMLAGGLLCRYVAQSKRLDGTTWFWIGVLVPLLSLLALIAIPAKAEEPERGAAATNDREVRDLIARLEQRKSS